MSTLDESRAFERYCTALMDLVDEHGPGFGGTVCRGGGKCRTCAGTMPPGIPVELRGTDWAVCAQCVAGRSMLAMVLAELVDRRAA